MERLEIGDRRKTNQSLWGSRKGEGWYDGVKREFEVPDKSLSAFGVNDGWGKRERGQLGS